MCINPWSARFTHFHSEAWIWYPKGPRELTRVVPALGRTQTQEVEWADQQPVLWLVAVRVLHVPFLDVAGRPVPVPPLTTATIVSESLDAVLVVDGREKLSAACGISIGVCKDPWMLCRGT